VKEISGVPASPGIAIGPAFLFVGDSFPEIPRYAIKKSQIEEEWQKFLKAVKSVAEKMRLHLARLERETDKARAAILKAHLFMVEDVDLHEQIYAYMTSELQNVEWSVRAVSHEMTQKLLAASDSYLRERAVDIADTTSAILNKLLDVQQQSLEGFSEDVIIVAHDILPSQLLSIDKKHVKALLTDAGSQTSHIAILARSFELPAVIGLGGASKIINNGDCLIVDGGAGTVLIKAEEPELEKYKKGIAVREKQKEENHSLLNLPAETLDGKRFALKANIELPADADKLAAYGAEGIGLFRTEFLFLSQDESTEEEKQYEAYSRVIKVMKTLPVTIRTCDVGGDKILPNFFPKTEKNPLLGWRAIRFSLAMPELFKAQLRAVLRAAAAGNAEIIFPLISCVEELDQALALLEEAKAECRHSGLPIAENIRTGVMIEVPAAVLSADVLAKKVDFFSIGTNDLIQYSLAVDRGNEKVNYLARASHPALIRLIKMTIDAAHKAGIRVAMCGEMAGDITFTPLLIGLGLDEFSAYPSALPLIKRAVRACKLDDCEKLTSRVLQCTGWQEVSGLLEKFSVKKARTA
jgi:phosphotransferase system enzyme I (PtsI)